MWKVTPPVGFKFRHNSTIFLDVADKADRCGDEDYCNIGNKNLQLIMKITRTKAFAYLVIMAQIQPDISLK